MPLKAFAGAQLAAGWQQACVRDAGDSRVYASPHTHTLPHAIDALTTLPCAAASAASRLREVLACAGATSFWVAGPAGPTSTTPSTSVRVRWLGTRAARCCRTVVWLSQLAAG